MRDLIMRRAVVVLATLAAAVCAGGAPAGAVGAAGAPPVELPAAPVGLTSAVPQPATLDPVSPYLPQVSCNPVDMVGPRMLRDLLLRTYGIGRAGGISRGCTEGLSEHSEGRAMDWMVNVKVPAEKAAAADFLAWVTRDDGVNARRLGIMYVIYNKKIWSVYNTSAGWRPSYAHTDHVHVSFSWNGARGNTSFWTGTTGVTDFGPCVRFKGSYAAPTDAPRATRCAAATTALVRTSRAPRAFGSTGRAVSAAQTLLGVPMTGRFDTATWTATRAWQRVHELPVTGALDHPTWASLDRPSITRRTVTGFTRSKAAAYGVAHYSGKTLAPGRAAKAVAILQTGLGMQAVDRTGYFGPGTLAAVVELQRRAGLVADGLVSGEEWRAIRSAAG
ncbi:peptidoglycan-binding domain-containing protein [Aeromicrobium fastidiosum]|uniref:Peptidoglycan-binding protein n=1 Tax=Aeromicrobium fastidiosum TaxID=52699 RepID=A0A641AME9_9ACTN|nr:peptidoglycan-binding protein [Aeromicrobium fastidiosum]KAA1374901.1 peptidoglycan-binding protein [Aeromicrobium fastidiosum]MBP2390528.1 peptidoglycan hydrolase-like protein with peptidoglycan-binding domain [Aeromicrobium fastidiosum]